MKNKILSKGILEIKIENINTLSEEEYALVRKESFGGSDSSVLCGVNLYKSMDQLIKEKNTKCLTKEEIEVGKKPVVIKGRELEPLILAKAEAELKADIIKPTDMFVFKDLDILTLNYDGITEINDELIPVEAKLVSKYGEKYYNKSKTIEEHRMVDMSVEGEDLATHIKRKALHIGIPAYYYTQCQQEMMGTDAPYCYLACLFDESWTFKLYLVKKDVYVQNKIRIIAENNKDKIKKNA